MSFLPKTAPSRFGALVVNYSESKEIFPTFHNVAGAPGSYSGIKKLEEAGWDVHLIQTGADTVSIQLLPVQSDTTRLPDALAKAVPLQEVPGINLQDLEKSVIQEAKAQQPAKSAYSTVCKIIHTASLRAYEYLQREIQAQQANMLELQDRITKMKQAKAALVNAPGVDTF
ncbi:MAG: hypothetical protein SFZ03_10660 [Candidatus Melainabacteria bacterium]|nr:hypothetical protein [Candidatus Melainabacteria bacterium]